MKPFSMLCVAMSLMGNSLSAWTTYLEFESAMINAVLDRRMLNFCSNSQIDESGGVSGEGDVQ